MIKDKKINKKGQFGPDALVSIVVIAIIGLGGVFFLHLFVEGVAMKGILTILDQEYDQRCYYVLFPMMGDEYIKAGKNVTNDIDMVRLQNQYSGPNEYMERSMEFEATLDKFRTSLEGTTPTGMRIQNFTYIGGYIASSGFAVEKQKEIYASVGGITHYCYIPVYSPVGIEGNAELFMANAVN